MMDTVNLLRLLLVFSGWTLCSNIVAQDTSRVWIVGYDASVSPDADYRKSKSGLIKNEEIFPSLNLWAFEYDRSLSKTEVEKLLPFPHLIRSITPNLTAEWRAVPNDPDYLSQWGMKKIGMEEVWDITTGGSAPNGDDIVIALFDDGYQVDHVDYADNVWINTGEVPDNGFDDDGNGFIDDVFGWNATTENDEHGLLNHGTSVAGIVGAVGDNNSLIAGMNWNAKMMLTSGGRQSGVDLRDIVSAYNYVFAQRNLYNNTNGDQGTYVVALSYSGGASNRFPSDFPAWCEVIDELGRVGVLVMGSAPNADTDIDVEGDLPGTCPSPYLITVTNTDRLDNKTQGSGFGPVGVDLGAPGDGIFTLATGDDIEPDFFGTSAATPFVAGLIPLMYSLICDETFEQSISDPSSVALIMKNAIMNSVVPAPDLEGITVTGGRLNAIEAINVINQTVGNCCEITIEEIVITDETCTDSEDGQLEIMAVGEDLSGPLVYQLEIENLPSNELGNFSRLAPGDIEITVRDPQDINCFSDTTVTIEEGVIDCPFGEFEITEVSVVNGMLEIGYNLDEQKFIQIQIHNNLGQLLYDDLIEPPLSGSRMYSTRVDWLPDGVYHASILATGFRSVTSFVVAD